LDAPDGEGLKITIDGVVVCSICGDVWKTYRGMSGDERPQCASCGARPDDEEPQARRDSAKDRISDGLQFFEVVA